MGQQELQKFQPTTIYRRSKHVWMTAMIVEVPADTASLADAMSQMRDWLDQRRCTPILFATTSEQPGTVVIRVEFADGGDAAAFRAAFGEAQPGEAVAAA